MPLAGNIPMCLNRHLTPKEWRKSPQQTIHHTDKIKSQMWESFLPTKKKECNESLSIGQFLDAEWRK